jgi:hypothetical protein
MADSICCRHPVVFVDSSCTCQLNGVTELLLFLHPSAICLVDYVLTFVRAFVLIGCTGRCYFCCVWLLRQPLDVWPIGAHLLRW